MVISRHQRGILSEYLAILFLRLKFYKILLTRYKTYVGEIDIIAMKNDTIVFIEVKSKKKSNLQYDAIRKNQINRIKNAALVYMASNKCYNKKSNMRFDLIVISDSIFINHIKNAW